MDKKENGLSGVEQRKKQHIMDNLRLERTGQKTGGTKIHGERHWRQVQKYSVYETISFSKVSGESDSAYCCVVLG